MRVSPIITKQIFFVVVAGIGCDGRATTFLLGSANADAQNARAKIPVTIRTDQPHMRLSLVLFPMP
ncbi:MAG: hypothetical protein DMF31_03950 [Verrucomicrobia bacterium]|nr:MAG: hypothetical protein DMF31_03950 [Verrucomicrobiota bacterium]